MRNTQPNRRVVLGLSGGVDSAWAAAALLADGYEVTGVYLRSARFADGSAAAARAAAETGIAFETVDITAALEQRVIQPFLMEYARGRTPNPCVLCNPAVKMQALFDAADRHGAAFVATGHYASTALAYGKQMLAAGPPGNDQSYMLYRLPQRWIDRLLFPLGETDKTQVRAQAQAAGIAAADAPDSMEICFIPDNDYAAFLERETGGLPRDGWFVSPDGRRIAPHGGIHRYTVGQRRGTGVACGVPVCVARIDPVTHDITLVPCKDAQMRQIRVSGCVWHIPAAQMPERIQLRVRHTRSFTPARVYARADGEADIVLEEPMRLAAPGQSAVWYDWGSPPRVLGGGWIEKTV